MTSIWAICFNHGESCAVDKLPNYPMKLVIPEVVRREKVEEEEDEEVREDNDHLETVGTITERLILSFPGSPIALTKTILLLKQVSCHCVGETPAWLIQQQQQRNAQYVGKTLPIYC